MTDNHLFQALQPKSVYRTVGLTNFIDRVTYATDLPEERLLLLGFRFRGHFLNQDQKITDILGSPMNRTDFKGQPASLFIVAECDALADQSAGKCFCTFL